uniref:Uncharacterized protein n=1 Tax=Kalanchoe fedtschenkoi TaxID=63787 RepID=A0A7N0V5C7_KALFE
MYPRVPASPVVWGPTSWSIKRARPKSPTFTLKLESNMMLLDLISRWTTHSATPSATLYRTGHVRGWFFPPKRWELRLPLGMNS